ncbi:hypothetical protein CEXT_300271 [Caerostris extrusa]|uniref:Uncharacterized protein n=1 Tax=Caerostris extrusa TaxID=172846 RepID=A0AAV4RTD6_CAEEX|nr:hypothetical protein CEXT_300271 [Caerostris extrusa]
MSNPGSARKILWKNHDIIHDVKGFKEDVKAKCPHNVIHGVKGFKEDVTAKNAIMSFMVLLFGDTNQENGDLRSKEWPQMPLPAGLDLLKISCWRKADLWYLTALSPSRVPGDFSLPRRVKWTVATRSKGRLSDVNDGLLYFLPELPSNRKGTQKGITTRSLSIPRKCLGGCSFLTSKWITSSKCSLSLSRISFLIQFIIGGRFYT